MNLHSCSERIYSGARWDMRGHMCRKPATVEHEGKWWCKLHSPDGKKALKEKREAEYKAEKVMRDNRYKAMAEKERRAAAYPKLVQALIALIESEGGCKSVEDAEDLLRELGESE